MKEEEMKEEEEEENEKDRRVYMPCLKKNRLTKRWLIEGFFWEVGRIFNS